MCEVFFVHMYVCATSVCLGSKVRRGPPDSLEWKVQVVVSCWELNPGPPQEQLLSHLSSPCDGPSEVEMSGHMKIADLWITVLCHERSQSQLHIWANVTRVCAGQLQDFVCSEVIENTREPSVLFSMVQRTSYHSHICTTSGDLN